MNIFLQFHEWVSRSSLDESCSKVLSNTSDSLYTPVGESELTIISPILMAQAYTLKGLAHPANASFPSVPSFGAADVMKDMRFIRYNRKSIVLYLNKIYNLTNFFVIDKEVFAAGNQLSSVEAQDGERFLQVIMDIDQPLVSIQISKSSYPLIYYHKTGRNNYYILDERMNE